MIPVKPTGVTGYRPQMGGDPLSVEKGWCHFSHAGQKDFLDTVTGYEPLPGGAAFSVTTFRGRTARAVVEFVSDTAFRLRLFPLGAEPSRTNEVFSFPPLEGVRLREEALFLTLETGRVRLLFRKCPWEMTVYLDGEELTKEQIKDHNVDQKYKAIPLGFTTDEAGRVLNCFETMYLYCDEGFYGFGEKFNAFNKRGQKITLWQRDAQSTNSDISYKGMPFFLSSSGYAVLLNTFTRTHFNMGAASGVSYTMEAEDPYLDYYMFCNRDPKGLLRDYTALSGRSRMIPRWAFGFWMSRMSYMSRSELEEIAARMADFGMSADVVHIDAWQPNFEGSFLPSCTGELLIFDEERFPDPEGMIRSLREKGLHLSLWMFPYVQQRDPSGGISRQYQLMKQRGYLVKGPDGEPKIFSPGEGDVDAWRVAALDFTNPGLVAYMKERIKRLMKLGVGVMKTDFSEELPEDCRFFDGSTGLESHNKYPLLYAKTIYEASREAKEEMGEKALLWGRWIDLETGASVSGGWITYPKRIDVIPLFLRENTMLPMLQTAPDHIADENFTDLELVLHITDELDRPYFDDGVEGRLRATLKDGILSLEVKDIPAAAFRIYAPEEITAATVNGAPHPLHKEQNCFLIV